MGNDTVAIADHPLGKQICPGIAFVSAFFPPIERWVDPVERVSIFLIVLFYCNGAPLQYVTRLPYGFRCLNTVCRYMEKLSTEEDAEEPSRPHKRMYFAPA